ncbi:VOC family protein [Reyranella sp.]|jgi:catechol 2,3-dioxygenase-like lactoylglutathione lyase family enzyme|uniref:VOC family protein n=1 Tax=Reyranella sp. TaxID=1929291 RepID=UPI002F941478
MMHGSTTVFTVKDVMTSLAYYRDKLGFDVAFEYGTPTFYVGLCSGDVTLHLVAASRTPRQPGHGGVCIFVDDVDTLHAELTKRGANVLKAPANYDYGLRDFDVADLDGNMIFFGMEIPKT